MLVLGADAAALRSLLTVRGYGESELFALENLGGPEERISDGWTGDPGPLTVFALECTGPALPLIGIPDDVYAHDGQLTKRDLRVSALARLAPSPGDLLWDVGAGAGSVGIEWSRMHAMNRSIAIERDPERAERIGRNAVDLGVPELEVVTGEAPDALSALPAPDAVFIGGGVTVPGVLDACLTTGARVVAHGVTLEAEQVLARAYEQHGGELLRIAVERAAPLGGFTGWTAGADRDAVEQPMTGRAAAAAAARTRGARRTSGHATAARAHGARRTTGCATAAHTPGSSR